MLTVVPFPETHVYENRDIQAWLVESFSSKLTCRKDDVKEEAKKGLRVVQVVDRTSTEDSTNEAILPVFPDMVSYVAQKVPSLRPRPHVSGYFRIRNFFFLDTSTVHTYPVNSTANREKMNPLSRVEKNISAMNPIKCERVNPDIFESDDIKSMSSLPPNNKPIWRLT